MDACVNDYIAECAARHDPQHSLPPPPQAMPEPSCYQPQDPCQGISHSMPGPCFPIRNALTDSMKETSGDLESNQGPSDVCTILQSDALPTELSPVLAEMRNASCQK